MFAIYQLPTPISITCEGSSTQEHSVTTGTALRSRSKKRLFFLTILITSVMFLIPGGAQAGTGTFRDGKFNFCVSVRFNATEAQLQRIREVFSVANQLLADATDGQHQFGTISIINNSGASDQAEFWIHPSGARANVSGQYGMRGGHVNLYYGSEFAQPDTIRNGLIVVHEFAHLAYDLSDEYLNRAFKDAAGNLVEIPAHCPGPDRESHTLSYCIMDNIFRGTRKLTTNYSVNEFCVASNHDKPIADGSGAFDTAQSIRHGNDSCWQTMSKLERKWRLTLPSGLPQDAQPSVQPVIFNTTCASQTQRVVLLIDRSGSMTTQDRLNFAKRGARHFVELYGTGDQLGIVSFATTASVNFPLTQMDTAARSNAIAALSTLSAAGSTNTGDGMLAALSLLNSGDCQDCQKTIILLSDGDSNVGIPPESLIQTVQASDVKVIAATVGSDISIAGEQSLRTISIQTGGTYLRAYRSLEFIDFLSKLAFGTSGYRGVANAPNFMGSSQVREIPVLVETGAVNTNFGISLGDQNDNVTLALRKPSGSTLTESNAPTGQFTSNSGLKVFKIPTPEAGTWTMVLTSGTVQSGNVQTFAYAQHDGTDFWASIDDDNVLATETLKVHATPTHDGKNVVGASVTGYVTRPDGSQVSIALFDDGVESHGDLSANDGVYSALFDSYSVSGTYTFDLKYQNSSGQTYIGEPIPNENGVVENFPSTAVPPAVRISSATAIVSGITDRGTIWFDDALPEGATAHADGEDWYWVKANPGALSGELSHQSRNFAASEPWNSVHQHLFDGATKTLPVNVGDKLFTYVFLDSNNMPREIMLQWKDTSGWEHRAYWGANNVPLGVDGTNSRRYMGPLPRAGTWVRLEVPANLVGLEGATLNGMAFTLDGGRATFDLAGKTAANAPPPPTTPPGDFIWVDDAVPAGSTLETVDDQWQWIEPHVCGTQGHRSHFSVNRGNGKFRSHSFRNAPNTMSVNPGDVLFTYVYLDANHMPDQLMLQWHDGTGWEHRAFWGENYIGQKVPNMGVQGTESQRYMGGIPPGNQWVRLEVPASYVGLEGKTVSGMAFGFYSRVDKAGINWDCSGKSPNLTTVPLPLSATSSVWRLYSNTHGWSYNTNDQGEPEHIPQKKDVFFVHPNEAAGTVPMHRFRKSGYEYFYTRCRTCPGSEWQYEGIAFYVFPDATSPGTVPLYLYHDNRSKYFLTINQNEATGMSFDNIWAYVYANNPLVPVRPYLHMIDTSCKLFWTDYASNETGFKVERRLDGETTWTQIAVVGANVTWYQSGCPSHKLGKPTHFRVRATNAVGDSEYSNEQASCVQSPCMMDGGQNSPPDVSIVDPVDQGVVGSDFAISANVFDANGHGTIANVEFFANGNKLGEVWNAPYVFVWNNAPPATYSLTAVASDSAGASTTSSPVNVTVDQGTQTITFDPIADKTYGDPPFAITAQASSGLPVSFTVVSGPATISGNIVTITGAGIVTVRASQSGDTNYNAASNVDRTFNVAKASATISLSNLNQTFDGATKTATTTTTPAGLSGVAITYNGSATAPTNAGSYAVVASLSNANYQAADATGTLTIAKASQTITFNAPANKTYGDAPFALSASSSSNLAVTFSVVSGPATISGSTVTITGAGTVTVRASQPGDANYNAASNVDRTFNVAKASATITLSNLSHVYDATVKNAVATTNPAGLSGVSISYSGPALTPINAGTYSVVATLTNANYTAPNATASLTVAKANPVITWQNPADIPVGTPLSATQLNATANAEGTFAYSPPAGTVLNVGNNQTLSVTFTPTVNANYNSVSKTVSINVATAVPLSDDFNDNSLDPSRWTIAVPNSALTVSEQGQQLRITIPPNTSGYNGIVSTSTYDLRGSTVEVEMAQPISQAGWCENFLQVSLDASNYFLIDAGAGSMVFRSMLAGNNDQTVLPVFDPVQHRYWRIRHDQGTSTIYFETSPDRVIWTSRKTAAVGFSLTAMRVHLLAGAWGTGNSNPGWAAFDNVRLVTNETANALPIANSGFELPVQAANGWQYAPTGGVWTFTNGGGVTANNSGWTNTPAPELNQVAFLQGGASSTISQPVAGFQANTNYVVTFAAAQRPNYTGQDFQVYLDSVLLGTFRPTSMGYIYYSTSPFSTTAGTHTLKFVGMNSSGGDNTAFIDNVRITQSSTAIPPVTLLSDDFNSTSLDATKWSVTDPARVTDNGQQLQISLSPNTAGYYGAYSNQTYDLTGRSLQVEQTQSVGQAGWCENYILVMLDGNNYLLIDTGAGNMLFRSMVNGANDQTVLQGGFNPAVHRYWRIRHDQVSNTIKFETSPDAVNWTIQKSAAVGFSLTSMRFYLYAGCWGTGNGNPGTAKFDNLRFLDPAYLGSPVTLPGTIEIENYDNGETGLGYYDTSVGTHGQDYDQPNYPPPTFRQPTNVDLYKHSTAYSSRYLIILQAGDWMKYSVNVTQAGNYTMYARIAWGGAPGGTFHIEVDGVDKTGPIQIPDTGWSLQMISKTLQLPSGLHSVKVVADTNAANGYTGDIDYLYFRLNP